MHIQPKILKRQDGFSQIEVILAAVILATLTTLVAKVVGYAHDRWLERRRVITAESIMNAAERWWEIQRSVPTINDLITAGFVPASTDTTGMTLTISLPATNPPQRRECLWSYSIITVTVTSPNFRGDLMNEAGITYDAITRTYTLSRAVYPLVYTDYLGKAIWGNGNWSDGNIYCNIAWNHFW